MEEKREEKQDKSGALTGKSSPLLPKARSWVAMNESPPHLPFPGVLGYMASIGSLVIFIPFLECWFCFGKSTNFSQKVKMEWKKTGSTKQLHTFP